ncbi:DNA polymerase III subunit beta [Kiloniella sp. b19]|uniref:DNA polymerase III subunit beta n=1 Tax=Kiloniella sp. GXU_MW_B19 TaxID=3141326 RepID=UPI0031E28D7C
MKLTIERSALLKTLAHVQSVVERRNTIPILSNVLMEAGDGRLSLTATDMDLTIVDSVEAVVSSAAAVTAPAHTLYDIVRKLPDGSDVEIDAQDAGQMTIKAGRSTFKLQTLPQEDFPAAGIQDLPQVFGVQVDDFKSIIDRTRFAISTEETRYYLNGIYLHATEVDSKKVLRAVATDGHRLARFEMALPDGAEDMPGVIIPRKTVNELRKLIDEHDAIVEVSLSDTKIRFAFGNTVLSSKLIDGTFPDYQRVIPSGNDKRLVLHCKVFSSAVDRVSTISSEKSRAVKLSVDGNQLTLSATSAENGSAVEELEVDYDGTAMDIGFNSRYLLDIAQQIEGDEAIFTMADAASPTIVQDSAEEAALYVLMPMRV